MMAAALGVGATLAASRWQGRAARAAAARAVREQRGISEVMELAQAAGIPKGTLYARYLHARMEEQQARMEHFFAACRQRPIDQDEFDLESCGGAGACNLAGHIRKRHTHLVADTTLWQVSADLIVRIENPALYWLEGRWMRYRRRVTR